jgi:hypothetical protein
MTRKRVLLQDFLSQHRQAVESLSHVGDAARLAQKKRRRRKL